MNNILIKSDIKDILTARFKNTTYNSLSKIPKPSLFKDMEKSSKRIIQAINKKEKIIIVGDYDVDGVVSTTVLLDFFKYIDYHVSYIIPNRFTDGYGISPNIINHIDADLIITVDNGITAIESAKICNDRGIDLIITDHHTPLDILPDAYSIINPKQHNCDFSFKEICGAQVAWYLVAQLKSDLNLNFDLKSYLDIVAIAIIADVMPLIELNRTMLRAGLEVLNTKNRKSLSLFSIDNKKITSEEIAFFIAPKLNSAGRLIEASLSVDFLQATTLQIAQEKLDNLTMLNEQRKEIEREIVQEAIYKTSQKDYITVVWQEGWNKGVVGIVASQLVSLYSKPAIVFSIKDGIATASARTIGNINIFELIKKQSTLLLKFGGHKGAAGLSLKIENLEKFKININQDAEKLDKKLFIPIKEYLGVIEFSTIDYDLINMIDYFEPFGEGNRKPSFLIKNIKVAEVKYLGKNKEHLKLQLIQNGIKLNAIEFRTQNNNISIGDYIDIEATISINNFRGQSTIQLLIHELN